MNADQMKTTFRHVWRVESASVGKLEKTTSDESMVAVVQLLADSARSGKRVVTTGCGTSGAAAKKIAHTLSCVEIPAFFLSPADSVHGAMGSVQKDDVVIAISKGGETEELARMVPALKSKGAKLVVVSENAKSYLAAESDILLRVKVDEEPDPFNMLATASTMAVIAVFDAIAIALMVHTNYSKDQLAVIHPGGAVGARLSTSGKK